MNIKAIETVYKGIRFRSRLEARWACFFDSMGIKWQYELEGFESVTPWGKVHRYLPDFFLQESGEYVEVKGSSEALWNGAEKMESFVCDGDKVLIVLGEVPYADDPVLFLHHYYERATDAHGLSKERTESRRTIARALGFFLGEGFIVGGINLCADVSTLLYSFLADDGGRRSQSSPKLYVRREGGIALPDARVELFWRNESIALNVPATYTMHREAYAEARAKRFEFEAAA